MITLTTLRSALAAMAGKLRSNKQSALRGAMCYGCGHEHNCGVSGCSVLLEAAEQLRLYEELGTPEEIREQIDRQRTHIWKLNLRIDELREQLEREGKT
jgi:hypothetical protein